MIRIRFTINFHTVWGQSVHIVGSIPELGNWNVGQSRSMQHVGGGDWVLDIEIPYEVNHIEYRYFLYSEQEVIFEEWQRNHRLEIKDGCRNYHLVDYWLNRPQNNADYSSAFTKSWFAHPCDRFERVVKSDRKLIIKVLAPKVKRHQSLAVIGNQAELGNWDPNKAVIMACEQFPEWFVEIDASRLTGETEYKFCVINSEDKMVVEWENGENRKLNLPAIEENTACIVSGLFYRMDYAPWKCAGTVIPLFALRSEESFGIGDFNDLHKMIDWLKQTNQKILQILPVNDTTMTHTWSDSYPYNSISIYALHPMYLNPFKMGILHDPERMNFFKGKQKELNDLPTINYDQVDNIKWTYFRELYTQEGTTTSDTADYQAFFQANKEWLVPYAEFSCLRDKYEFTEAPFFYYIQYHLHLQLSEATAHAHSNDVVLKGDIPIGISRRSVEAWQEPELFHMDCQTGAPPDDFSIAGQNWGFPTYNWEAMENDHYSWWKKRFANMAKYFDAYRIDHILGFFRIWEIPDTSVEGLLGYFHPALPFSEEEFSESGFNFNKYRFTNPFINEQYLPELFGEFTEEVRQVYLDRATSELFSLKEFVDNQKKIEGLFAWKSDHKSTVIKRGLFTICNDVLFIEDKRKPNHYHPRITASSTYVYRELSNADRYVFDYLYWHFFYQRHNDFWKEQGIQKLTPLISSTDMLVCGEDLGMIPACVPDVMNKLQILSLEIERMPKVMNEEFADLRHLPALSVCTTSTHDMSPIRSWWKEDRGKTQRYYNTVLNREGEAPEDCTPEICTSIIRNHLNANSMLTIIPFQDWIAIDSKLRRENEDEERINVPANPLNNWNYRMHIGLEKLLDAQEINNQIKTMIQVSSR